jgi:hypothetical protein
MNGGGGKQERTTSRSQAGSVLVVAMLVLVLLALLGVAATTTTCIEFHMAGNDRTYVGNFYRAEGAALLGARRLEGVEEGALRNGRGLPAGMNHVLPDADPFCEANWTPEHSETALDQASRYLWVHPGRPAPGSSLDLEGTRLHHFDIYGRSDMNRGTVMVQIGYRKRF